MTPNQTEHKPGEAPLESWKEIGAYLNRNEVTARRWEKEEGLPIHRQAHKRRSSVYAYPSELDAWRAARKVIPARAPVRPWWRPLAFGTALLLCLMMVGNGIRPQLASAQHLKQTARQVWSGPDVEASGSVSADGRYLSYIDWSTGDLAIRDLHTGKSRRITDKGSWEKSSDYAGNSAISQDGAQIAYSWFLEKDARSELRVLPLSGAQPKAPRTLLRSQGTMEAIQPVGWSPDEKQLLVERFQPGLEELGIVTLKDGSYRALKSSSKIWFPKLSPDGRWVAYAGVQDPTSQVYDVYVLSTDTAQEVAAVQNPANDVPEAWSPDGSRLYFVSTRTGGISLWSIPIASGKATGPAQMVRADTGTMFSMGMTRAGVLYYGIRRDGAANIYTAELGPGSTLAKSPAMVNERLVNSAFGARLSPDGKSLAYDSIRAGPEHLIIVRTLETGKERDFRPDLLLTGAVPMWFPDGRSLLIAEYDRQKLGPKLFRLNLENGEQQLALDLTKGAGGFALSPDGKALFYAESDAAAGPAVTHLVRYDMEAHRGTRIRDGRWINGIAVSPDSKQLALILNDGSGAYIAVMPGTGGPAKEILRESRVYPDSLAWTPDQRFLLFGKFASAPNSPASLWRVPVAGGQPEPTGISQMGQIRQPQMHPDGKRLFYTMTEPNTNEIWALENFVPSKGGK